MLALSFHVGDARFALPCRDVVEVVPLLRLTPVPHAPAFLAGVFDYRGVATPVVDLNVLVAGRPCADLLSTRIMIVRWRGKSLGVLAERVTEAIDVDPARVRPAAVKVAEAPYLGGVVLAGDGSGGMTQLIAAERLVPDAVRALLEDATDGAGEGSER
jgi:chemotaxis-related protein WspB